MAKDLFFLLKKMLGKKSKNKFKEKQPTSLDWSRLNLKLGKIHFPETLNEKLQKKGGKGFINWIWIYPYPLVDNIQHCFKYFYK